MLATAKSLPAAAPALDTIASDLASLKRDLAALAEQLTSGARAGADTAARDAVDRVGDEGKRLYGNLAAQGERSLKAIGRQVEEQPVMSLLLAFALGFAGSRWLSR
jgi:hypothetical protein